MIPGRSGIWNGVVHIPRASGDDPIKITLDETPALYSPRERG